MKKRYARFRGRSESHVEEPDRLTYTGTRQFVLQGDLFSWDGGTLKARVSSVKYDQASRIWRVVGKCEGCPVESCTGSYSLPEWEFTDKHLGAVLISRG